MIRIRNVDGITQPIRLHIDNIVNTLATGASTVMQDFEGFAAGTEVTFQEPNFSGSTAAFLAPAPAPNSSLTTDALASQGAFSDQIDFQFINATATNWIRLTTFNTPNQPNPAIHIGQGSTLSFDIRAEIIPEPAGALAGFAGLLLSARRRTRRR